MRTVTTIGLFALLLVGADIAHAQRVASPRGESATQIGDHWIVVDYSRPILRGRTQIFGEGEEYGQMVTGSAPVWRAGANKSTRLMTETDLHFGSGTLTAGEYSLFVDLSSDGWTLIFSTHAAKETGRGEGDGLWGAYGYTDDKDVLRVPMTVSHTDTSVDQFTIGFHDVTDAEGTLSLAWEKTAATAAFTIGKTE